MTDTTRREVYGPPNPFVAREVCAGMLSPDSTFRLIVDGPYRRREVELIVDYLRVARKALENGN